jgi:hypothetical protein
MLPFVGRESGLYVATHVSSGRFQVCGIVRHVSGFRFSFLLFLLLNWTTTRRSGTSGIFGPYQDVSLVAGMSLLRLVILIVSFRSSGFSLSSMAAA